MPRMSTGITSKLPEVFPVKVGCHWLTRQGKPDGTVNGLGLQCPQRFMCTSPGSHSVVVASLGSGASWKETRSLGACA